MREQITKLMLGNGLAQLLQFGSILILSRIYEPGDFGLLAQIQSISMIASIVLTLQLHLTIPLSKDRYDAQERVVDIQTLCFSVSLVALIPAFLSGDVALYALVLSLFLGLTNTYTGYLVYSGDFGRISRFYVVRALLIIAAQVSLSFMQIGNGLIIASLMGEALSALYLRFLKSDIERSNSPNLSRLKLLISRNSSFSFYGTIQEITSVTAFFTPMLLFSLKYGESIGGQYAMASRLVWAPIVLISSSIAQVLYHKLGKENPITDVELKFLAPEKKFTALAIIAVLATFAGVDLICLMLGKVWVLASELIPMQLLWGILFLGSTPYRVAARVLQLQKYQLFIDLVMITLTCLLFYSISLGPKELMMALILVVFVQHSSIVTLVFWKVRFK